MATNTNSSTVFRHTVCANTIPGWSYSGTVWYGSSNPINSLPGDDGHGIKTMRSSVKRPPTPDADEEEKDREPTLQEIINIKLIESGEKERLKELLRERLVECGWKDEMKALCRAFARKRGRNNVTVDDLVHVITPKGRASIPDSVKAELLQRIRSFLASTAL
ncbi:hypothetical protein ACH5RR_030835 [Cinchona calisaya]|uniref:Transcription and mRNA export factor ENY2 n=1 Tax=Cinchona calisaya TaxID=153742 RepID=A0ABD2YYL3_9GENT